MRNLWLPAWMIVIGCSSPSPAPAEIRLLLGQENETWSTDPAPTRVQVELVETTQRTVIGEANAPATAVTLRNASFTSGTIASFEATAFDAAGTPLVRGMSVPYVVYSLANASIPIFVARSSTWSRPPEKLGHARNYAVAAVAWHQLVISVGGEVKDGSPAVPDVYDAVNWKAWSTQPAFSRTPKSIVVVGDTLLLIDETGASWVDRTGSELPPSGLSFSEVAGGDVFEVPDANCPPDKTCLASYVVGATRSAGEPTSKVLRVDKNGILRAVTLAVPRLGAAAGVVAGNLVVWGGSAEGPGAEVLSKAQDAFSPLPFAPDATAGLGLATLDGNTVLLAGGKDPMTGAAAPFRTFDVTCAAECATTDLATAPAVLQRTRVFPLAAGNALVTGDFEDGEFHAFAVATSSGTPEIVERTLRERRKAATSVLLPNRQPGVLGGENPETGEPVLSIETFFF